MAVQLQNAALHISLLSGQNLPKPHGLILISSNTDFPQTMLPLFCSRIYYHTIFDAFFANFVSNSRRGMVPPSDAHKRAFLFFQGSG